MRRIKVDSFKIVCERAPAFRREAWQDLRKFNGIELLGEWCAAC
jgi:hypothetical protein